VIYLVSQIFFYLAIAMLTGVVTGWLLAQLRRRTALAAGATQISQLRRDIARRDEALVLAEQRAAEYAAKAQEPKSSPALVDIAAQLREQCDAQAAQLNDLQVELARLYQQHSADRAGEEASNNLITALHTEIARLRQELQNKNVVNPKQAEALELANKELEGRLIRKLSEVDRLEQALVAEERRFRELERERELQNKSLHVLHQQLEMEREPEQRAAG
jgi:hypothetical protein